MGGMKKAANRAPSQQAGQVVSPLRENHQCDHNLPATASTIAASKDWSHLLPSERRQACAHLSPPAPDLVDRVPQVEAWSKTGRPNICLCDGRAVEDTSRTPKLLWFSVENNLHPKGVRKTAFSYSEPRLQAEDLVVR